MAIALRTLLAAALIGFCTPASAQTFRATPTQVAYSTFAAQPAQCTTNGPSALVPVRAVLRLVAGQARSPTAQVETIVDGVSLGVRTLRVIMPVSPTPTSPMTVDASLSIPVTYPSGSRRVQFVVNRDYRTAEQSFTYTCLSVAPNTNTARLGNATIVRPDIIAHQIVIADYDTPPDPNDPCRGAGRTSDIWPFNECRLALRTPFHEIEPDALLVSDFTAPVPLYRILESACPHEGAPTPYVMFYFGFETSGIGDVVRTIAETDSARSYDARLTAPAARPGNAPLPIGHVWMAVPLAVPCVRNGTLEYHLDPLNRLAEQSEDNNVIRFRYSAVR